ncbi:MAG TPA: phage tail terminator-like protein [Gammaproteobacteria bacterium]|nr:phage tail terminator-like protein [Gammaproteobacteria bacterium]
MTQDEAYEAVAAAFTTFWNDETPIAWDDNEFKANNVKEYVRFSWQVQTGSQASLGPNALQRYEGILFIQVFTPRGKGVQSQRNRILQQRALQFFEVQQTNVVFVNSGPRYIGPTNAWQQTNVSSEFWFDAIRAA